LNRPKVTLSDWSRFSRLEMRIPRAKSAQAWKV
jgi:hypothetical protein